MLRNYSKTIVKDLRANKNPSAADSFVGLFANSGESHSDTLLEDLVLNFLIAGRDTTAQAMAWCLWNVLQHPEVEARILDEASTVCSGGPLTYDQIAKLEYLQAVISENLRLFPSVPIELKYTLADDTLPNGTFVPRGTSVAYSAYCMGRSTKLWGPDAEQFRPERWLAMEGPVDAYTYPVFHAGPRECLGKRLAMVEMKALLLKLLRSVKLNLAVPPEEIRPDLQVTLGMSTGLPCYVAGR
jgi:cytochrome P450